MEIEKCKVNGCKDQHTRHYCRICQNSDSDHFSSKCQNKNQESHCKVKGCTDNHKTHFCRSCGNQDSSHFKKDCSNGNGSSQRKMQCKAKGCQEIHENHFCQMCKDYDSDHSSHFCPLRKGLENQLKATIQKKNSTKNMMNCKAKGCVSSHKTHHCQICGDKDSDHRTRYCPKTPTKQNRCKAVACFADHKTHHCKICEDKDSDHRSMFCPNGTKLYHGTTEECGDSITTSKFSPSTSGRMGPGIYLTPEWKVAQSIAKLRQSRNGKRGVIITAVICKKDGYSKEGEHGTWPGVTTAPFMEVLVPDDKHLRILGMELA